MCGSQYSSLLKRSENIKGKFEDSPDYLCVRGTSAPWSVAPRCVISAPHITAPTPRVYFCKNIIKKAHMWNSFAKRAKLQKLRPVAPQPGGLGAGRPAAGRPAPGTCAQFSPQIFFQKCPCRPAAGRPVPPGSGAAGVYSCKFQKQKYIFVKNKIEK